MQGYTVDTQTKETFAVVASLQKEISFLQKLSVRKFVIHISEIDLFESTNDEMVTFEEVITVLLNCGCEVSFVAEYNDMIDAYEYCIKTDSLIVYFLHHNTQSAIPTVLVRKDDFTQTVSVYRFLKAARQFVDTFTS